MTAFATIKNLTHRYPNGRLALSDVSFEIAENESVALVGPNGAGKSTLFFRLAGLLSGPPGVVLYNGQDVAISPLPETVGILFQNPDDQLVCATVADELAFGPVNLGWAKSRVADAVKQALQDFQLTALAERAPFELSGGEKRRVALAAVMILAPKLLLLDEPTAFFDPRGRKELIETLRKLPGSRMIATHDLDFALDCCERVILLDEGRIFADGPTREVLSQLALMNHHGLEVPYRLLEKG